MSRILDLYGYAPKRGVMPCPFHGERNPSLKIYPDTGGWHCFGCGKGGSVIDFVMEHENCNFSTAVRAIDGALKLRLMDPHEDPADARQEMMKQKWLDDFVGGVMAFLDAVEETIEKQQKTRLIIVKLLEEKARKDKQSVTADEWTEILKWKDEDEYDEDRKKYVDTLREEVAAWRRKARRAK